MIVRQSSRGANKPVFVHRRELFRSFLTLLHDFIPKYSALSVAHTSLIMGEEAIGNIAEKKKENCDFVQFPRNDTNYEGQNSRPKASFQVPINLLEARITNGAHHQK